MSFYSKLATTAGRLLTKFGTTINVSRTTGGSIDPVTGAVVAGSTTVYTPNGIYKKLPDNLIDGTRILASDKMIILDDTIEPLMSDTIDNMSIVEITPVKPATTNIVYFVVLRK